WGEFDVPDPSCPHWRSFEPRNCTSIGYRQYSSLLDDIPRGLDWQTTCEATHATVKNTKFDRPTRCIKADLAGIGLAMWGEFNVPDGSCMPAWKPFKKDACIGLVTRQYSSLLEIPEGLEWEGACAKMPADVSGVRFSSPTRCVKTDLAGIGLGMWGEFDVTDPSCIIDWHYPWLFFGVLALLILVLILGLRLVSRKR
ncbi:MAG: hypothetical protein ACREQV_20290, partial [Candidatus Binatia bacterium]